MKILTVLGTRPEIIRLSRIVPALDELSDHTVVHTGQNDHPMLDRVFFEDFELREPDEWLGIAGGGLGVTLGRLFERFDALLEQVGPDRLVVLGDTDSALSAIVAKRRGVPVFHLEAGNRCFDDRVPEEVNRRIIDHASDVLMPYTERSRANLLNEGIAGSRIHVIGNPIGEILQAHAERIDQVDVANLFDVADRGYLLVTLHRAENVDLPERISDLFEGVAASCTTLGVPALVSVHPRTRNRLSGVGYVPPKSVRLMDPVGFFEFAALQKRALAVLTDSGTVQEECTILRIPVVTLRDVTERPETVECGANLLSGSDPARIAALARQAVSAARGWPVPAEYLRSNVTDTVCRIVTSYHHGVDASSGRAG